MPDRGTRILRADLIAALAALALLLVMALDWYGTVVGDEARRIEQVTRPSGAEAGQVEREVAEDARVTAERDERNAWQPFAAIDAITLAALLLVVALTVGALLLRAGGRRFEPPWTPSYAAALVATAAAVLVAYRTLQRPGIDETATIKAGPPLALLLLAVVALQARAAVGAGERAQWEEPDVPAGGGDAEPAATGPRPEPS